MFDLKRTRLCVIGLGYVGLPLAVSFAKHFEVVAFDINPDCFYPKPKIKSSLLEFTPKKNIFEIQNPNNIEHVTRIFFNQRRKMIKKRFVRIFKNFNYVAQKINIKLTDRPQSISVKKFLMIIKEYEKNLN